MTTTSALDDHRRTAQKLASTLGHPQLSSSVRPASARTGAIVNTCGSGVSGDLRFGVLIAV